MSVKLWIVLYTLREMLQFVDKHIKAESSKKEEKKSENEGEDLKKKFALDFAKTLLNDQPEYLVRHNEELFIRRAIASFPYKQSVGNIFSDFKKINFLKTWGLKFKYYFSWLSGYEITGTLFFIS